MKILIAIANYGSKNDDYLSRVLSEYRRMPYQTDFVVFSNVAKDLGPDVEVRVGLPDKDPWSLPFGHKQLFAERGDRYDLFLYSEDDILVTQRNIDAYLRATEVLSPNQLAGFFRFEEYADGRISYPDVRDHFHWVPGSLKKVREFEYRIPCGWIRRESGDARADAAGDAGAGDRRQVDRRERQAAAGGQLTR